ncbi:MULTISPECIES: hypothetical protein [Virgibacillus]|uniref:Uncharacterized protein n=1 Tax=Virgibacillus pantothenticus TaxID=1473 RepID=A0A0L0QKJ1_VIRPA|nr:MULTISPECIES: hypothetical protein [Virgibacillus]API91337.1 hypothetical protein BKP57_05460 [Virgibacillus sp. 6R]KNE19102.1 hypothetical protein AFK71_11145 [Virgibacillus pantothenticus]MBS7426572.1 hypothetical protein [Virgibacillus sp. 19R1-5]MED3736160.1 hypothetical protein [Virgibacillus pantothenticus]QTY15553.1 hypothetical protein KBP50_16940 [Virgibacillus pantothenticus]
MKLFQVRKGQFVFYRNELHQVYSVKPMFKKSVHLYRLKDMQQILTKASEIELCRPQHNDTFIFYGKRYTIDKNKRPEPGDYILIIKPAPDFLDHYSLNAIEKVDSVEDGNVVTTRDNGVKHSEYVVMVPGKSEASREIAYYDKSLVPEEQQIQDESITYLAESDTNLKPAVGDIYIDVNKETKAMIVAMTEDEVIFGHGVRIHVVDLLNEEKYKLVYRFEEDL